MQVMCARFTFFCVVSVPYSRKARVLNYFFTQQPIDFLSLLHHSSLPPYRVFVECTIRPSDHQASIFLQQKLKVADLDERAKIVDAIYARGFEMMAHGKLFFSKLCLVGCSWGNLIGSGIGQCRGVSRLRRR
jgi:hypothetical protein